MNDKGWNSELNPPLHRGATKNIPSTQKAPIRCIRVSQRFLNVYFQTPSGFLSRKRFGRVSPLRLTAGSIRVFGTPLLSQNPRVSTFWIQVFPARVNSWNGVEHNTANGGSPDSVVVQAREQHPDSCDFPMGTFFDFYVLFSSSIVFHFGFAHFAKQKWSPVFVLPNERGRDLCTRTTVRFGAIPQNARELHFCGRRSSTSYPKTFCAPFFLPTSLKILFRSKAPQSTSGGKESFVCA